MPFTSRTLVFVSLSFTICMRLFWPVIYAMHKLSGFYDMHEITTYQWMGTDVSRKVRYVTGLATSVFFTRLSDPPPGSPLPILDVILAAEQFCCALVLFRRTLFAKWSRLQTSWVPYSLLTGPLCRSLQRSPEHCRSRHVRPSFHENSPCL